MEEEQKQDQNQEQNTPAQMGELDVEQLKKKIIPTRLGSLVILLAAIIAAVAVQWYADLHFPPNGIEVSGLVEQMQERREVKSELPEGYEIKADGVYYMGELTEEADSEMFERLSSSYIKYKNDIYFSGERIEGFDIATFEYLGGSYVKDKDHVYYPFIRGLDFEFGIIKEVDMETFEYLDFFYAKDKNHVYELGEVSEEENWRTGEVSEEKDPATFEILNRYITKDKNNVYYYVLTSAKGMFREADPETFEILGDRYYKDKNNVYHDYFDYNKIEGADPETFEILDEGCSKDKNYVYRYGEKVERVDLEINVITENMLKNSDYQLFKCPTDTELNGDNYFFNKTVCKIQLKDGEYDFSDIISDGGGFRVGFYGAIFSDLDGDGIDEALVTLRVFYGGNGNTAYIAVVKLENDKLYNTDTILIPGSRQSAEIISVNSNIITVSSYGHYDLKGYIYKIKFTETGRLEMLEKKEFPVSCLASGTKILMSGGNYKNIEDIKVGDLVISFEIETKEHIASKVNKVIKRKDPLVIINDTLRAAPDEPVYLADGSIKQAVDIKVGDYLLGEKGNEIKVVKTKYDAEVVDTYDFTLENANNFFADGYLVGTPDL
ncbi:MAG: DKNYY domain-containing protein [Candidatus Pacebacteria bacterium]|nr:DKNYY domain-containing protein [Candidatus Paceibacterota bacterium]